MAEAMRLAGLSLALALLLSGAVKANPVVRLGSQELVGLHEENGVASFRGIAYARPPVGALRWKAPLATVARRGRVDATRFGAACAQDDGNTRWYRRLAKAMGSDPAAVPSIEGVNEDCLYLNVWTPDARALDPGKRLPVMVWIHGGSNENGYAHEPNYLGSRLARQDVVVVSINYRVGLLGFFAHPALGRDASGRQGLLDQVAALRWINAHIARFGGDPERVTLFGESAGGTDIAVLAAMPQTQGLFARAIIQSGYLQSPTGTAPGAVMTRSAAERLMTSLFDPGITAAKLRAVPWQDLVRLQREKLPGHFHAPVADWPRQLSVPLLIGSNADEYLMYLPGEEAKQRAELANELAGLPAGQVARIEAWLSRLPGTFANRADAVSAGKAFHCPSARLADATAASGRPVFAYGFEKVRPGKHGLGAYHGAEIAYVFDSADLWLPGDAGDRELTRIMQAYWVNFAQSGDPNGPGLPAWPQWQGASPMLLGLGTSIAVKPMPLAGLCDLLDAPSR